MKFVTPGLWVRLGVAAAFIWLVLSISDLPTYTIHGQVSMTAIVVLVAIVIIAVGFVVQWIADYWVDKKEE